jgi:nifR3 family TIM-barrel protein
LTIGNLELKGNIFLAPMAGVTDLPFRLLCKEQGASLVYTEMVSAKALHYNDKETCGLLETHPDERPVAVQIFGSEPEIMAEAAEKLSHREEFALIDINMGCPAPKIVKNFEGSALMRNPELVRKIVREVVRASKKPVTVKIRKGWTESEVNAVKIALICEEEGAMAVTVHGRTREQFYSGNTDLNVIKEVKESLTIPVIGNGDIRSPEDAERMVQFTGCDGVMVGRGAQGNPWIFKRINEYYSHGRYDKSIDKIQLLETILRHYALMEEYKGERMALLEMRKHVGWYLHGLPGSAHIRAQIFRITNKEEVIQTLKNYLS